MTSSHYFTAIDIVPDNSKRVIRFYEENFTLIPTRYCGETIVTTQTTFGIILRLCLPNESMPKTSAERLKLMNEIPSTLVSNELKSKCARLYSLANTSLGNFMPLPSHHNRQYNINLYKGRLSGCFDYPDTFYKTIEAWYDDRKDEVFNKNEEYFDTFSSYKDYIERNFLQDLDSLKLTPDSILEMPTKRLPALYSDPKFKEKRIKMLNELESSIDDMMTFIKLREERVEALIQGDQAASSAVTT